MSSFLPNNYQAPPSDSAFMKFEEGENRFRALGGAIVGWEDWDDEKKVYRTKDRSQQPEESRSSQQGARVKHFWIFPVWNYKEKRVMLLTITQATVKKAIEGYLNDADFGDPQGYDIVVKKSGSGKETEYQVIAKPPKVLDPEIARVFASYRVNLEALFSGGDVPALKQEKQPEPSENGDDGPPPPGTPDESIKPSDIPF